MLRVEMGTMRGIADYTIGLIIVLTHLVMLSLRGERALHP
jgi:hypothetical protein